VAVTVTVRSSLFCALVTALVGCVGPDESRPDASRADTGALPMSDASSDAAGCAAGQMTCGGRCVDTQSDAMNCGACGVTCAAGQLCVAGACRSDCPAPRMMCGASCIDVQTDGTNCGMCGRACPAPANAASTCAMGVCGLGACNAGFSDCDRDPSNGCEVDTRSSAMNCGACGTACAAGEMCVSGACRFDCPLPRMRCTSGAMVSCVDASTDVNHCGSCGRVCTAGANATATCTMGSCGVRCNPGFADCDGNAANGCEVDINTSAMNCGACNTLCRAAPNATSTCIMGACSLACAAGFANCDMSAANGCEANTNTSAMNCGACGTVCPAGANATATCASGMCGLVCSAGFANCDGNAANGCEANTNTSAVHCGMCGRVCAAGSTCMAGTCVGATGNLNNPFDSAANFPAGWSRIGVGGSAAVSTLSATCARTGAMGLDAASDLVWKNTPVVGAAGTRASVWLRAVATGRAYLVFGISGTTGFSFTLGSNTSTILWQQISMLTSTPSYSDLASTAFTFTAGQWYRAEVVFDGTSTVRGNLYGADGTTVVWTGTRALPSVPNGGVGLRAFNGLCLDQLDGVAR